MRLDGVELRLLHLELRQPIGTARGPHRARPVIVVRVLTEEGDGWGECGALDEGTAVDPPLARVWETLLGTTVPRLLAATSARDGELPEAFRVLALFAGTAPQRMAAAAVEMAVLDAELRAAGASLAQRLQSLDEELTGSATPTMHQTETVAPGAMVGIPADRSGATLVRLVDRLVERGYHRIRVKIEPGWDLQPLRAVRRAHPALSLSADANGSFRLGADGAEPDSAARLVALDELELVCIEQPLAPPDLAGHADLARRLTTPVCLDESLTSVERVRDAIRYDACSVACLKPARLGGLLAAQRAQAVCRAAGTSAFVGGFFETGLGRTANAALATLGGFTIPGDLSPPSEYLVADPFDYPTAASGRVPVYQGPGVSPHPELAPLGRWSRPVDIAWLPVGR